MAREIVERHEEIVFAKNTSQQKDDLEMNEVLTFIDAFKIIQRENIRFFGKRH